MKQISMMCKAVLTIVMILSLNINAFAQLPPPPAMPSEGNKVIVDKIIEATQLKEYVSNYCNKRINSYARNFKWSDEKTNEILQSARFEYFEDAVYYAYAFHSTKQLKKLLDALMLLNNGTKNTLPMIVIDSRMHGILDEFIMNLVQGKYVIKG